MTQPVTVVHHAGLAAGRWHEMPLVERLANIGSEVGRATRAKSLQRAAPGLRPGQGRDPIIRHVNEVEA